MGESSVVWHRLLSQCCDTPNPQRQGCHVFGGSVANEPEETRGVLRFLESNLESVVSFGL